MSIHSEPRDDIKLNLSTQRSKPNANTIPLPDSNWNQQRQLLLEMLEKNQQITVQAQNSWAKQKQDLEKHYSFIQQCLKKQLNQAKQQNNFLKTEISNLKKGTAGGSRIQILQQLQRVDFAAQDRQADLIQEIKSLKAQLNTLQASVGTNKNRAQQQKQYLQTQIEIARTDTRRIQADCTRNADDIQAQYDRASKEILLRNQELEKTKAEYQKKFKSMVNQRSEVQDTKINQKKNFLNQTSKVAKRIQDKQKQMFIKLQEFQQQKANIQTQYLDKLHSTQQQIANLRQKLQQSTQSATKRQDALNKQLIRLRNSNTRLLELSQQKEGVLQKDLQSVKLLLKKVQTQYQQKQAAYIMESAEHIQQLSTYQELLKQFHYQQLKTNPINQSLRYQVQALQDQLRRKDEQLNNLRDLYINKQQSERRMITKTIISAQSLLVDINKQQNILMKEQHTYSANLRELEQQASDKQKQQSQTILELAQKLENLRKDYQQYKSNQWEQQLQKISYRNMQLKQDLEHARNNLEKYMMDVRTFEQISSNRIKKGVRDAQASDQIRSLQLEIERLNAQNSSLVDNRTALEAYFIQQIQKLQSFLEKINYQLAQLYSKSDRARNNKAKKHLQQIASWQNRQQAFTKIIKNLQSQVKALSNQAISRKHLSQHQASLETQELNLLRNEVSTKQEWIAEQVRTWESQKQSLVDQIDRLNSLIQSFRGDQDQKVKHMNQQYELLKCHKEKLIVTTNSINQQMEILTSNSALTNKYDQKQQKVLQSSYNQIAEIIKQEAEALKQQLALQRDTHRVDYQNIKANTSKEIRILKDIEESLNKHITAQQKEIDTLTQTLADQKHQHSLDLQNLRSQLNALRRANSKKHLLMHNENVSLTGEINRLLSLVQRREQTTEFQQKTQQIQNAIQQRVLNYDRTKMQLQECLFKTVDEEIADIVKSLKDLRGFDQQREKQRQQEKQLMNSVIQNLRRSVQIVQDSAQADSQSVAVDLELAMKKLKLASSEKQALKQQRDKLLQTLSKSRSLSKSDRNTVSKLIDQLKTHPNKKQ